MDYNKEIPAENLTQKDLMTFLLHSTQHVATREELQDVKTTLKEDINKLDTKIDRVETSLKEDINKLDTKIDKISNKFDRIQWLIISTILTVLLKDYIIAFFKGLNG